MKKLCTLFFICLLTNVGFSQSKLFTKTGTISFSSVSALEKIQAINKKVLGIIDVANNNIEFALLIKGFEFEKALMQEHFNENYLESDKYPKATFKGKFDVEKLSININETTQQTMAVSGVLQMHGVSKNIQTKAIVNTKAGTASATCQFSILLSDYNIKIPAINKNNVNNQVQIQINLNNLTLTK
jgi:polyisoprenoid-binding protein YceI